MSCSETKISERWEDEWTMKIFRKRLVWSYDVLYLKNIKESRIPTMEWTENNRTCCHRSPVWCARLYKKLGKSLFVGAGFPSSHESRDERSLEGFVFHRTTLTVLLIIDCKFIYLWNVIVLSNLNYNMIYTFDFFFVFVFN